jgi:hypothetical protein
MLEQTLISSLAPAFSRESTFLDPQPVVCASPGRLGTGGIEENPCISALYG